MRFVISGDPRGVGIEVAKAIKAAGHEVEGNCDDGVQGRHACAASYTRLVNYGDGRKRTMRNLRHMVQADIPTVPEPVALDLYDDKLAQMPFLAAWLPRTNVIRADHLKNWIKYLTEAKTELARTGKTEKPFPFPFVSKSSHGSGSANVRLIATPDEAIEELERAFAGGIEARNGAQQGYCYWQELVPGNAHDVRVIVAGRYLYGIIRHNRPDVPFASGSGNSEPITDLKADPPKSAFVAARILAEKLGSRWCCFDFVYGGGRPYCLEVSFAWTESIYLDCPLFDRALQPTGRTGREWPQLVVERLEDIARGRS